MSQLPQVPCIAYTSRFFTTYSHDVYLLGNLRNRRSNVAISRAAVRNTCWRPRGTLPSNIFLNAFTSAFFGTCFVVHESGANSHLKFCSKLSLKTPSIIFKAVAPRETNGFVKAPPVGFHRPVRAAARERLTSFLITLLVCVKGSRSVSWSITVHAPGTPLSAHTEGVVGTTISCPRNRHRPVRAVPLTKCDSRTVYPLVPGANNSGGIA